MSRHPVGAWLIAAAGVAVLASLAATVAVIGSPARQRLARMDERRVRDIDALHDAIELHARGAGVLPSSLAALGEDVPAAARRDPATGSAYRYERVGDERYRLCARFALASSEVERIPGYVEHALRHPAGMHCYTWQRGVGRVAP